jgi:hypothetical protein
MGIAHEVEKLAPCCARCLGCDGGPTRADRCGEKTAMMALHKTTRAQNRARYIATERHLNHQTRLSAQTGPAPPDPGDDDPPPFCGWPPMSFQRSKRRTASLR